MAALYLVAAWLILQVTEVLTGLLDIPDWVGPLVLATLAIGLPIALVLSWFFEITDSGITRDPGEDAAGKDAGLSGRKLDFVIIAMLAAAVLVFAALTWWPSRPVEQSIAVLAFDNMSDDPAQDYFSDGIAEEILGTLAKFPELRVISRSSSFSFKGKNLNVPSIANQLNVAHILEGSVRKSGNQVRISAQLIEAATDSHLWSETYERELTATSVFNIQTQIANSIAEALNAVLSDDGEAKDRRPPTRSLPALQAYMLGKQRMALRTRQALTESLAYFETAIDIDPEYASAYLGLADANLLLNYGGHMPLDEAVSKARPAIEKAIDLDARFGAAYASLGLMRSLQSDVPGAESALKRAIALDPNDAKAYHWYGDILIFGRGDPGSAVPVLQKARQLDPLSPVIVLTLGEAYSTAGQLAEGLRLYRKALEIDPDYVAAFNYVGMGYLSLGDPDKATYWLQEGARRAPEEIRANAGRAFLNRARGDEDRAVALAYELQRMVPGNNTSLVTLVSFGHDQEAIDLAAADWPGLTCEGEPAVHRYNVFQAMNLSLAYERMGEVQCAETFLTAILDILEGQADLSARAFGFLDVEVYARLGKIEQALALLRVSVDAGMRMQWQMQIEDSPHVARLRDEPEFLAIREEVLADLAHQLAIVRTMEARGELAPLGD
ncbi:MAG: tetratricopeptide repeat protein [Proteobacteria bacterium]|nr:tetratricopeptide repeat protein [Pseudomonadota bacterium]